MAGSLAALLLLMAEARLTIDMATGVDGLLCAAGIGAIVVRSVFRVPRSRWQRLARDASENFGLLALVALTGVLASYADAAATRGFVDVYLEKTDLALGFDWIALYIFVAHHPAAQLLGRLAYGSIFVTPILIVGYLTIKELKPEARSFIATLWFAAIITLIVFRFAPAQGPLAFLWKGPLPYMPTSELYHVGLIPQLRHHMLHEINLGALEGLVAIPSFHTTCAVIFVVSAWPFRTIRWIVLGTNVAMLLSTPVEGTHYLVDMVAGAAVALIALRTVAWLRTAGQLTESRATKSYSDRAT
jgi:hypothetical protein